MLAFVKLLRFDFSLLTDNEIIRIIAFEQLPLHSIVKDTVVIVDAIR